MKTVNYTFIRHVEPLMTINSSINVADDDRAAMILCAIVYELNKRLIDFKIIRSGISGCTVIAEPKQRTEHCFVTLSDGSRGHIHISME
jgi:hypothetical protein